MTRFSTRRAPALLGLLALTTGGVVATAPAASAAPAGYQVVRSDTVVAAGGFLRTSVTCPAGKVVVGGGASVIGAGSGNFGTVVQESAPGTVNGGAQSVWLAAVRNTGNVARTIGVSAVCANTPAGYQVVRSDTAVAANGFVRTTASCPAGKVVLGGGASVIGAGSANFGTTLRESAPGTVGGGATSLWLAAVSNGGTARTIGVHAVCANTPAGYQVVRTDSGVGLFGFLRTTSNCPAGKVTLGGGAQVVGAGTANFGTVLRETAPGTVGGGATSLWLVALANPTLTPRTIGVFSVCAS